MSRENRSIATIVYADLFSFPLTRQEYNRFMIGERKPVPAGRIRKFTVNKAGKTDYITLKGREKGIAMRLKRQQIAADKWLLIPEYLRFFTWIPSVRLIGVTGGLAVDNTTRVDDVDLFVITASGTMWATRGLVTVIADIAGIRRKPGQTTAPDRVCLNMFMSEDRLSLPPGERDLFSAHEVLQMVPVHDAGGVYRKFLTANRWAEAYLPNAWKEKIKAPSIKHQASNTHQFPGFGIWCLRFLEIPARVGQLWYMKRRLSSEVIRGGMIRFHPTDARGWIKKLFAERLAKFNIPLDNIFYHR